MSRQTKRHMERRTDQQLSKKLETERQKIDSDVTSWGLFILAFMDRHTDRKISKRLERHVDKQTNRQMDRQTWIDRHG
jgi:hypothetical protein